MCALTAYGGPVSALWHGGHVCRLAARSGAASKSFTSTAAAPVTVNARVVERVERCPAKKAYLRLSTSHGDLNLELHADITPRAAENFLVLAKNGYYTGTSFHRSIRNFMVQVRCPLVGGSLNACSPMRLRAPRHVASCDQCMSP